MVSTACELVADLLTPNNQVNFMATPTASSGSFPVAPDSVRVWRGFRHGSLPNAEFFKKLGSIFIPGTVLIQQPVRLSAYLPTVLAVDKPPGVPDEIALVFYEEQKAYEDAKRTVGGRAYSDMHALVFDLGRSISGFPVLFQGVLKPDEKYYLFKSPVDWQHGHVNVFVGARGGDGFTEFQEKITKWVGDVQNQGEKGPDGAIVSVSWDYAVYWEHWPSTKAAKISKLAALGKLIEPVHQDVIAGYTLPAGLWESYVGVDEVKGGESFNFQFRRRSEG